MDEFDDDFSDSGSEESEETEQPDTSGDLEGLKRKNEQLLRKLAKAQAVARRAAIVEQHGKEVADQLEALGIPQEAWKDRAQTVADLLARGSGQAGSPEQSQESPADEAPEGEHPLAAVVQAPAGTMGEQRISYEQFRAMAADAGTHAQAMDAYAQGLVDRK